LQRELRSADHGRADALAGRLASRCTIARRADSSASVAGFQLVGDKARGLIDARPSSALFDASARE